MKRQVGRRGVYVIPRFVALWISGRAQSHHHDLKQVENSCNERSSTKLVTERAIWLYYWITISDCVTLE
jgi:hypothetical protein